MIEQMLPRYRCHKIVRAAWIVHVDEAAGSLMLEYDAANGTDVHRVSIEPAAGYFAKHRPEAGGYFVVYDDGYQSFSPAKAFLDGYAKISAYEHPVDELAQRVIADNPPTTISAAYRETARRLYETINPVKG